MFTRFGRTGLILFGVALFGGPLLSGFAGHGWAVLPVFAALFLLYAVAARKLDLATGAGWAGLATLTFVQIALVASVWAIGLAGGVFVGAVMLPVWAPILLTAVAAGFGAWAWRDAAEMDVMLDNAIEAIEELGLDRLQGLDWPDTSPEIQAALDEMLETLRSFDKMNPGLIDPVVQGFEQATGAEGFDAFYDLAGQDGDDNEPLVDFALLRYIASPFVLSQLVNRGEGGLAPQLLLDAPDAVVRAEAQGRVIDLLDAGAPADQIPDRDRLALLAARFPGEGFDILAAHCRRAW